MWRAMALLILAAWIVMASSLACQKEKSTPDLVSRLADSLNVELEAPSQVKSGEIASLKLSVLNVTADPLTLEVGDDSYEFVVTREDGTTAWRYWYGKLVEDYGTFLTLEPGEIKEYEVKWDLKNIGEVWWEYIDPDVLGLVDADYEPEPLPAGTYLLYGAFRASPTAGLDSPKFYVPREVIETGRQKLIIE